MFILKHILKRSKCAMYVFTVDKCSSSHGALREVVIACSTDRSGPCVFSQLTSVQGLMGLYGETKYLLGVLTEIEDGNLFIEDTTGVIKVEMANAVPTTGLFTENCIIIAEGQLREDGVFELSYMGFPMLESRFDFR